MEVNEYLYTLYTLLYRKKKSPHGSLSSVALVSLTSNLEEWSFANTITEIFGMFSGPTKGSLVTEAANPSFKFS